MSKLSVESATLFTPGRTSHIDEDYVLQLNEGSIRRSHVAADAFNEHFHDLALFAGGFPGLSQGWNEALTPPTNRREAHLMALPLIRKLEAESKTPEEIERIVATQGDSSNSFGDVILSIERGLLDPNKFNNDTSYGIDLATGALHGRRFRRMLSIALDIDPRRIRRLDMSDVYGTPEYPHQPAESRNIAIAKEIAAIAATEFVLRNVTPGNLESLKDAEQHFIKIVSR